MVSITKELIRVAALVELESVRVGQEPSRGVQPAKRIGAYKKPNDSEQTCLVQHDQHALGQEATTGS